MVVGVIGKIGHHAMLLVEAVIEREQGIVDVQHQQMEELNALE